MNDQPGVQPASGQLDEKTKKSTLHRAIAASAIGNGVEWFDYGIYAVAVAYISVTFFPGSLEQQTGWALATFAISFLVRPLGGLFWGPLGDKIGRKRVLALTILLMAIATFGVGLLPAYDTIGIFAPIILIFLRMVQGFSTGGEYGGAATFMAEYAPDKKRGFYGSFLEFGTLVGFASGALLVLLFTLLLGDDTMQDWGWRLPFLVAGPLGLIGFYLRSRIQDTPVFRDQEEAAEKKAAEAKASGTRVSKRGVFKELFKHYPKQMIIMVGMVIALNVTNYTMLSFMPTYLEGSLGMDATSMLVVMCIVQFGMAAIIPFAGRLSDKIGRRPMWIMSVVGLFVMAIPMYMLMGLGIVWAVIGFGVLGILYLGQLSTISATFPALFPTHVRFAGFAITYNVATAAFGGTAPYANEALIVSTGSTLVPAVYMMAACAIGLIAALAMRETNGVSLRTKAVEDVAEDERIPCPGEEPVKT